MLTPKQAWAIANLIAELRPEWQAEGVVSALKRCKDGDPFLTALAAVRAAADKDARTPGVIPTQGTHWQDGIKREPPRRSFNMPCTEHPGETLPCGRCANERVPADVPTAAALARAELAMARAHHCSHGIDRRKTRCGDCERPAPTAEPEAKPAETTDTTEENAA